MIWALGQKNSRDFQNDTEPQDPLELERQIYEDRKLRALRAIQKTQGYIKTKTKLITSATKRREHYRRQVLELMVSLVPMGKQDSSVGITNALKHHMSVGLTWDDYHEIDDMDPEEVMDVFSRRF